MKHYTQAEFDAFPRDLHERDALRAALIFCQNTIEWMQRGTTHWDKCEEAHPLCAMALRIAAALAAKEKP